jgi:NAD(P)-dependent dehydrogenase (short-subunit alcohol dehydrogenase family)
MSEVIVVIGAGLIGQAIARRVSAGKHVVLGDLHLENADAAARPGSAWRRRARLPQKGEAPLSRGSRHRLRVKAGPARSDGPACRLCTDQVGKDVVGGQAQARRPDAGAMS